MGEWEDVNVQASHGGHMSVVRELLDHGANVTADMIQCPLIQQPMKQLLEKHFIEYVLFVATHLLQCCLNHSLLSKSVYLFFCLSVCADISKTT